LFTALAGGVLALVEMTRRGVFLPTLYNLGSFCVYCVTLGRSGFRPELGQSETFGIPYGVPIALGTLAVLFLPFKEWML
jgi:Flp pilus assembly protein protease CpaA